MPGQGLTDNETHFGFPIGALVHPVVCIVLSRSKMRAYVQFINSKRCFSNWRCCTEDYAKEEFNMKREIMCCHHSCLVDPFCRSNMSSRGVCPHLWKVSFAHVIQCVCVAIFRMGFGRPEHLPTSGCLGCESHGATCMTRPHMLLLISRVCVRQTDKSFCL
jgi:hypothetical protein